MAFPFLEAMRIEAKRENGQARLECNWVVLSAAATTTGQTLAHTHHTQSSALLILYSSAAVVCLAAYEHLIIRKRVHSFGMTTAS